MPTPSLAHLSRRSGEFTRLVELVTFDEPQQIRVAAEALRDVVASCSLRIAICHDISTGELLVDADKNCLNADVFGWFGEDKQWWENHSLALESPLPQACRYESESFWCNSLGFHCQWPNEHLKALEPELRSFFKKERNFQSAVLFPAHLGFGRVSASCLVPLDPAETDMGHIFSQSADLFAEIIRKFVRSYTAALECRNRVLHETLSRYEVLCLRWASVGKTDSEIAEILHRSHATVRYHITRAGEKLHAVNRAQTLAIASRLGYLKVSNTGGAREGHALSSR